MTQPRRTHSQCNWCSPLAVELVHLRAPARRTDVALSVGGRRPATFPWKHSVRNRHGLDECAVSAKGSDGQLQRLHANHQRPRKSRSVMAQMSRNLNEALGGCCQRQRLLLAHCDSRPVESPLTLYLTVADAAPGGIGVCACGWRSLRGVMAGDEATAQRFPQASPVSGL